MRLERVLDRLSEQEQDGEIVRAAGIESTEACRIRDPRKTSRRIEERERPKVIGWAVSEGYGDAASWGRWPASDSLRCNYMIIPLIIAHAYFIRR